MFLGGRAISYCGAPATPSTVWARWNLDPILIGCLLAIGLAYGLAIRAGRADGAAKGRQAAMFYLGWAIGALALVSPLCATSVALFSARISQHMALTLVAAPLVAAGHPWAAMTEAWGRGATVSPARGATRPWAAAGVFALALWFWHAPTPYALTFSNPAIYWAMHLTLFGSALWLWSIILDPRSNALNTAAAGLISSVQMGLLGAIITLAPHALYPPHALTTAAWGLTPLQDQQLGGAIMWIPGCIVFLAVAVVSLSKLLQSGGAPNWSAARPQSAELGRAG